MTPLRHTGQPLLSSRRVSGWATGEVINDNERHAEALARQPPIPLPKVPNPG
jgi:hypothetical protein